jgi:hypothetical protein
MVPLSDEIWRCAEHLRKGLEPSTIARGFLHGHQILKKKVVEHKGENIFLPSEKFCSGIDKYNTLPHHQEREEIV